MFVNKLSYNVRQEYKGETDMILIIEDDSTINSLLCGILKKSGYEVESCTDGLTGYNMALDKDYQLILMDLMLPMKSGEEILRALREVKKTPVIVLSAKNDVHNRIELLRLGADDFICKPFDIDEVILRIEAVLRRVEDVKDVLTYKQMRIDKEARRIFIGDDELICTATEYAILELMLGNPGKVPTSLRFFSIAAGSVSPISVISPSVGKISPATIFINVLLPAPFSPIKP